MLEVDSFGADTTTLDAVAIALNRYLFFFNLEILKVVIPVNSFNKCSLGVWLVFPLLTQLSNGVAMEHE